MANQSVCEGCKKRCGEIRNNRVHCSEIGIETEVVLWSDLPTRRYDACPNRCITEDTTINPCAGLGPRLSSDGLQLLSRMLREKDLSGLSRAAAVRELEIQIREEKPELVLRKVA